MSNPSHQRQALLNAVCMHCGYDIAGLQPSEQGLVTCPECGHHLHHDRIIASLTPRYMHKRFAKRLFAPTIAIPLLGLLCVWIPVLNMIAAMFLFIIMFSISLSAWFFTVPEIIEQAQVHPRRIPRWRVILWSIFYLLPQLATGYLYMQIASRYMIQV